VSADDPIDLRLLPGSSTVDDRGHLVIGGSDLEQLARVFSTSLYVYDEDEVVARCRAYAEAFGADAVAYAAKAFLCGAMARIVATASFSTLLCSMAPETPTGWAAPTLVPGAMAATEPVRRMNVPAEAARAPSGETYVITGTGEFRMAWVMVRIEESSPPGVSMVRTTAAAFSLAAASTFPLM